MDAVVRWTSDQDLGASVRDRQAASKIELCSPDVREECSVEHGVHARRASSEMLALETCAGGLRVVRRRLEAREEASPRGRADPARRNCPIENSDVTSWSKHTS